MKKILLTAIVIISIIAMMNTALAVEISSFDADYTISGTETRTIYTIRFTADNSNNSGNQENFSIDVPGDAQINSVSVDDLFVDHSEQRRDTKKTVTFSINSSGKTIKAIIDYTTNSYIDSGSKNYFISDIRSNYPVQSMHARVGLPENSFLSDSKEQGGSVFPEGNIATDGKIIFIEWTKEDLQAGNSFPMFVIYKTMRGTSFLIYIATLIVIGIISYFGFPYLVKQHVKKLQEKEKAAYSKEFTKSQDKTAAKKKEAHESKESELNESAELNSAEAKLKEKQDALQKILAHLTEDEQQIVNILADREGHIEQGTLVIITGFSKAHLSRLLDELQRRRIIHKEKKGKKNVVWLKSQF